MNPTQKALAGTRSIVEKGWCQGAFARNQIGDVVLVDAPEACSFCLIAAISKSTAGSEAWGNAVFAFKSAIGWNSALSTWNDQPDRTRDEVLAAIDAGIARAA
ncbi:hypothetical protein [Beijerinckia sp. L45]|uniref:DUF6197 family protein n=1 Tax=Beijerinckia sp. L45 TaxID=1641855 RepID=UPI00131A6176|nr:hypothetical protein [Beijerinckia sp. L45]